MVYFVTVVREPGVARSRKSTQTALRATAERGFPMSSGVRPENPGEFPH